MGEFPCAINLYICTYDRLISLKGVSENLKDFFSNMYHNDCVVNDSYFNCLVFVQSCMLMQRGRGTVELRDISVFHEHYEESMCFVQFFGCFQHL